MTRLLTRRTMVALALLGLCLAWLAPAGFGSPGRAQAQTPIVGAPFSICGQVTSYTAPTAAATGSITFSTVNITATYTLAAGATVTGTVASGSNLCMVGAVNGRNQLVTVTFTPNTFGPSNVVLCGNVTAYTAATNGTLGSLTIGGTTVPLALGAALSGITVTTGSNLCVTVTLNALGQIVTGTVAANNGTQSQTVTPVAVCGPVSSYTAATASAAGTITISNANVTTTFSIPAGSSIGSGQTISTGTTVCIVGLQSSTGALTSGTITLNPPTTSITVCGTVTAYTPAATGAAGALTLAGLTIPLAFGTTFTGTAVTTGANLCVTGPVNGLGLLTGGSVTVNTIPPPPPGPGGGPTATPTITSTPGPTDTPTVAATATNTPTPTATPKPKPAPLHYKHVAALHSVVRMGAQQTVSARAQPNGKYTIQVHIYFATGKHLDYQSKTSSNGSWSATFYVPKDTISKYSSKAIVTFQVWKGSKTVRSFATFYVIR